MGQAGEVPYPVSSVLALPPSFWLKSGFYLEESVL